jgi:serine/threonine protein kinase
MCRLDHWELTSDQIWFSREKLGSGAYGQVYKGLISFLSCWISFKLGKIRGKPPCIDHYYRNQIHIATRFENCDVAIKMLPKYASETAKKEFLREIELVWIQRYLSSTIIQGVPYQYNNLKKILGKHKPTWNIPGKIKSTQVGFEPKALRLDLRALPLSQVHNHHVHFARMSKIFYARARI